MDITRRLANIGKYGDRPNDSTRTDDEAHMLSVVNAALPVTITNQRLVRTQCQCRQERLRLGVFRDERRLRPIHLRLHLFFRARLRQEIFRQLPRVGIFKRGGPKLARAISFRGLAPRHEIQRHLRRHHVRHVHAALILRLPLRQHQRIHYRLDDTRRNFVLAYSPMGRGGG